MPNIFTIVVEQESGETEQNMGQLEEKNIVCFLIDGQRYPLESDN